MVSSSITPKFRYAETDEKGRHLYWGTHAEGFPSLEPPEQAFTDKEQQLSELQYEPGYAYFELPKDKEEYLKLMDKLANGLYWLLNKTTDVDKTDLSKMHCHIEWVMPTSTHTKRFDKYNR